MRADEQVIERGTALCATGRALVVLNPSRSAETDRRSAGFLTQLLACERRLPAYRSARKEDPATARAAYLGVPADGRGSLDLVV